MGDREMSRPTPRTDSLAAKDFVPDGLWIAHARTLERELASERAKVRALQTALESVADAWHTSHETNPFRAGDVMLGIAEKALVGEEGRE
jgi:hypothetical protein